MRHHPLLLAACLLLLALTTLPTAARPAQAPDCFEVPGIVDCINGRIKEYWNGNGGLPVFGYPITPERPEPNRDTGQTYQTQTFERNRFELHPENRAPYDVLLGRLGAESLARQGRDFEPPTGVPTGRCTLFDVGGRPQYVCDRFLDYWVSQGLEFDGRPGKSYDESLALFGLPLTTPKSETNPNGDTVITQYFERARFEDHGTKGVLLGLLGREQLGSTPTPPPAPNPTPTTPPAPNPTPAPPPPSFNNCQFDPYVDQAPNTPIRIVRVRKLDTPEVVVLQNVGTVDINLDGWRMCSITGNQEHTGIGGVIAAGQTRDFPYTGSGTIWNNGTADDGSLYNPSGQLISYWRDQ